MDITSILKTFCDDSDYRLRLDYSGRGMYGAKCVGICVDENESSFTVGIKLALFASDFGLGYELIEVLGLPVEDSLGLGKIIYFPEFTL